MSAFSSLLKSVVIATSLLAVLSLGSCNTVAGFGRDIENTGTALENAANR